MARKPIPTWNFAVVVVQKEDQFLIVQEAKHGQNWYLPAGRLEPGESFEEAARRETLEEAGIPIQITGILRIEHTPAKERARMRVVFLAQPLDDRPLKSEPDSESLGAAWVTLDQLPQFPLRGAEVIDILQFVANGGACHPLNLIRREGLPYTEPTDS